MASSDPSLRRLARQLVDVDQRLKNLETVPQLAHSSLDDQGLPVYDADGNLTVTLGRQPDGTWGAKPVAGPVPPAPVGLDAEGDAGTVRASWQGVFWAGAALPMDFEAVQVLVDGLVYAAIHDPQGGSVSVPATPGERVVSFRTLSQAGVVSEPTVFGNVTVEPRVSEQMLELGEDLSELRDVTLPELSDELDDARTDLQSKLDAANQRIDDIVVDGGGSGNFTTYSVNEPSGDGTGEGDQWFRVVNGEVLGQWRWDGAAWQAVTLTDAVIAGIDLSKLISNGNLSEVVANKVFTDIFTSNKITSQEIAAGSITTEKIAAEGIIADVIQGGAFTGETFEGGTFTGGLFKTSDDLPGQVAFSDTAFHDPLRDVHLPGVGVAPLNQSDMAIPPGIGAADRGLIVSGGTDTTGARGMITASPTEVRTSWYRSGDGAHFAASNGRINMQSYLGDGSGSTVNAEPTRVSVQARSGSGSSALFGRILATTTSASADYFEGSQITSTISVSSRQALLRVRLVDGQQKAFRIDDAGIWVDAERNGTLKSYNLEETAQDSGWINLQVNSGFTIVDQPRYRNKGGVIFFAGVVEPATNWASNTWPSIFTMPSDARPAVETLRRGTSSSMDPMLRVTTGGLFTARLYNPGTGIIASTAQLHLSPMFYAVG